ncbi:globin domain-containing protein [Paludibacterium yongneupense]|uniref:globin domain-containing protein n=1 Tax=Paludibacterium yongneupense TaxID=400061 RepID=UPI001FE9D384|nr:globin domain-containing protein [Paludibacterium yongneupense]
MSPSSRPYIAASVPVLREHGLAITRHFYADMFRAHPELTTLFNMGNQANGAQQQSLAAAVFAYAANIDNAAALAPVIERIVHKHAAVGIGPAHYPVVGRHLLGAIAAVLGDAATPGLLAAWDEAYWLLAGELIAAEARLYQRTGTQAGELIAVRVAEVREESEDVRSYLLQTADGNSPGGFQPGQYISVEVGADGWRQRRQYSLSDAPSAPWWRISVKRESAEPKGRVSNWLHTNVKPGDSLQVSPAFGDFTVQLEGETPLVLLSAGIGVTPMISALNTLLATGSRRPVLFVHAARNGSRHALRADLERARAHHTDLRVIVAYECAQDSDRIGRDFQIAGRVEMQRILEARDRDGDFYLCGPLGFMQAQWQSLLTEKISPARMRREVFGPELLDHLR